MLALLLALVEPDRLHAEPRDRLLRPAPDRSARHRVGRRDLPAHRFRGAARGRGHVRVPRDPQPPPAPILVGLPGLGRNAADALPEEHGDRRWSLAACGLRPGQMEAAASRMSHQPCTTATRATWRRLTSVTESPSTSWK